MKEQNKESREERVREAAGRLNDALGALPPKFFEEAYGTEKTGKSAAAPRARKKLTAPAWLRPVAACLAVLILGGLVVFSIPVVNNIISHRAPAELPGTDVAEADTKEEETEKKEETEAPVETEEVEVSQFDKKYSVSFQYPIFNDNIQVGISSGNATASFNDVLYDENKKYVGLLVDAEKITAEMTLEEMTEIMGVDSWYVENGGHAYWALDDGRVLDVSIKQYGFYEVFKLAGVWDYENNTVIEVDDWEERQMKVFANAPVTGVDIVDEHWEYVVKEAIKALAKVYAETGNEPSWGAITNRAIMFD